MEKEIVLKARRIPKSSRVAVYPMSTIYGDLFTTYASSCYGFNEAPVELSQPFQATLENFYGSYLYLRTNQFYCVKVGINKIRDIVRME